MAVSFTAGCSSCLNLPGLAFFFYSSIELPSDAWVLNGVAEFIDEYFYWDVFELLAWFSSLELADGFFSLCGSLRADAVFSRLTTVLG